MPRMHVFAPVSYTHLVVVIAQGASDIQVKMELAQAVQTALGVSASKVDVFEMKP